MEQKSASPSAPPDDRPSAVFIEEKFEVERYYWDIGQWTTKLWPNDIPPPQRTRRLSFVLRQTEEAGFLLRPGMEFDKWYVASVGIAFSRMMHV